MLDCGHKFELNRWQEILTDRNEVPESAVCNFCGRQQAVQYVAAAPTQGEYKLGDAAYVFETENGMWRWERRGKLGDFVDVSEDFAHERDATVDAGAHNLDNFDRR